MPSRFKFEQTKGLFITGTDTGVGKTLLAGAIVERLRTQGRSVGVFKPIATGCRREREGFVSDDAEFLAQCAESEGPLSEINPVRYQEPLAPWVATERSGCEINWEDMQRAYADLAQTHQGMIVEGIGGVMVPLMRDYFVLDLMVDMNLPVIIVARSTLGTLNHTLLTVNQCRQRGLSIRGIVINGYRAETADIAQETNTRVLAELSGAPVLTVMPYEKSTCVERGLLGEEVSAAVGLVRWGDLIDA